MARYILAADGILIVERRATPRFEIALRIEIGVAEGGESILGMTTNLSESGVQVLTRDLVPQGKNLKFRCPSFAGTAEAIWSREEEGGQVRSGFRFVYLSRKDRDTLLDILGNLKRQSALELTAAQA